MRGTFRRDAEIRSDPRSPGAFSLVRGAASRMISRIFIVLSFAAALVDLWLRRPGVAVAQLLLFTAFLLVHVFSEAWSWNFSGDEILVRGLAPGSWRVREEKLRAKEIRRVCLSSKGSRSRVWLELESGATWALVEGRTAEVEKIADTVQRAVLLARMEPKGQTVH